MKNLKSFESFSIKNPLGQEMVTCHDCGKEVKPEMKDPRNNIWACPMCGLQVGTHSRDPIIYRPVNREVYKNI